MSPARFNLVSLTVVGPGRDPAEVTFGPGLNVISGASDTGKSYIYGLINFMLGSDTLPEEDVPESRGYETAYLTVTSSADQRFYTLERSLKGGDFRLYDGMPGALENPKTLEEHHAAGRTDTVSAFLLQLSGLADKFVLKKKGPPIEVGSLSFRNLVPYILISEERVFTKGSPIHREGSFAPTLESSLFKLLLTGMDDRSLIGNVVEVPSKQHRQGQVALLGQLVARMEADLVAERERQAAIPSLVDLDAQLNAALAVRDEHQQALQERDKERQKVWRDQKKIESRLIVLDELLSRFGLLRNHYESDLNRLDAVSEAEHAFAHLAVEACPMCGSPSEAHQHEHTADGYAIEDIQEASKREADKIHRLMRDLESTIAELKREYSGLTPLQQTLQERVQIITLDIEKELAPRARVTNERIIEIMDMKSSFARLDTMTTQLASLRQQQTAAIVTANEPAPKRPTLSTTPATSDITGFCLAAEELLKAWRYPHVGHVSYNPKHKVEDIVVADRARSSHGKGIRAILYSAFALGLMRYCLDHDRPHPGFVVIDSPLVAYKEADKNPDLPADERLSVDFKDSFYQALADGAAVGQVIILENQDPPKDVNTGLHYVHFSKSEHGRYGFFPV